MIRRLPFFVALVLVPSVGLSAIGAVDLISGFEVCNTTYIEFDSFAGTPDCSSLRLRSGDCGCRVVEPDGERVDMTLLNSTSTESNIYGLAVNFRYSYDDASPTPFLWILDSSASRVAALELSASDEIVLRDSNSAVQITSSSTISATTWYFVEVYIEHTGTGAAELFIDGQSVGSDASGDYNTGTNVTQIQIDTTSIAGGWTDFDDLYVFHDVTNADDRCSYEDGLPCEVFYFSGGAASVTPDSGSNLDSGQWSNLSDVAPVTVASGGSYTGTTQSGQVIANDVGHGSCTGGPAGCADVTGATVAGNWLLYASRGNGSATVFSQIWGNDVDTPTTTAVNLDVTKALFRQASNAANTLPTDQEYCLLGIEKDSGGRDFDAWEHWCYILHRPSQAEPSDQQVIGERNKLDETDHSRRAAVPAR